MLKNLLPLFGIFMPKKMKNSEFLIILAMVLTIGMLSSCKKSQPTVVYDFPQIIEKDTLTVLTLNSSSSYFIYRDQEMGFHYDMISDFCKTHGLELAVKLAKNSSELIEMLQNREGDVIAYDVPIKKSLKDSLIYCGLSSVSHQVLVQRADAGDSLIQDVTQLINQKVTVISNTKYYERLVNLNNELGGGIQIEDIKKDTVVVEDLIRMVSFGEIKYTVADENIARINRTYFRNLNIDLPVSFDQRSSWAVRKDTPILADSLDKWFNEMNIQPTYRLIAKRYFEESKGYDPPKATTETSQPAPRLSMGQISLYDTYFKKYGQKYGLDWRLIASVSYQESNFEPNGKSWAGAVGLMGLMPATAASLGVRGDDIYHPEMNIKAGALYLSNLIKTFASVKDMNERIKIALAAYNGGIGHIFDARALANKYNADPEVWDNNVEKYLHMKRFEEYYNDPICKSGYFRGDETLKYVPDVMNRWHLYQQRAQR